MSNFVSEGNRNDKRRTATNDDRQPPAEHAYLRERASPPRAPAPGRQSPTVRQRRAPPASPAREIESHSRRAPALYHTVQPANVDFRFSTDVKF